MSGGRFRKAFWHRYREARLKTWPRRLTLTPPFRFRSPAKTMTYKTSTGARLPLLQSRSYTLTRGNLRLRRWQPTAARVTFLFQLLQPQCPTAVATKHAESPKHEYSTLFQLVRHVNRPHKPSRLARRIGHRNGLSRSADPDPDRAGQDGRRSRRVVVSPAAPRG